MEKKFYLGCFGAEGFKKTNMGVGELFYFPTDFFQIDALMLFIS